MRGIILIFIFLFTSILNAQPASEYLFISDHGDLTVTRCKLSKPAQNYPFNNCTEEAKKEIFESTYSAFRMHVGSDSLYFIKENKIYGLPVGFTSSTSPRISINGFIRIINFVYIEEFETFLIAGILPGDYKYKLYKMEKGQQPVLFDDTNALTSFVYLHLTYHVRGNDAYIYWLEVSGNRFDPLVLFTKNLNTSGSSNAEVLLDGYSSDLPDTLVVNIKNFVAFRPNSSSSSGRIKHEIFWTQNLVGSANDKVVKLTFELQNRSKTCKPSDCYPTDFAISGGANNVSYPYGIDPYRKNNNPNSPIEGLFWADMNTNNVYYKDILSTNPTDFVNLTSSITFINPSIVRYARF